MAETLTEAEYFFLPIDVWLNIVVYLDVESLQALQESDVVLWDLWDMPTLSRSATLSRHSDASALLRYLLHCDVRSLRILRLTGCLMALPQKLFQALSVCVHLAELYCVNCILSPRRIFDILTTSMPWLIRLEWSLFDEQTYSDKFDDIAVLENQVVPKLRHMYVEVADYSVSWHLLNRIRKRCESLVHLHVHAVHADRYDGIDACSILVDPDWMLESFAYTSHRFLENGEWLLAVVLELRVPPPDLCLTSAIFGNVTFCMHPVVSCTCIHLTDVIAFEELAIPEEELIFCVACFPDAPTQLAEVAHRPWLRRLQSLTFVLLPPSGRTDGGRRSHYVSPARSQSLSLFLRACYKLTELNLSLVHFESGTELCQIFPSEALPLLRAIALRQCALQTNASLQLIAASCAMLEELDVRGGNWMSTVCSECPLCSLRFTAINRDTVSALHRRTRLQRLTLFPCYGLRCYRFLAECSLVRLRLSWPEQRMTCCDGRSFIAWFSSSEHLRSLTLCSPNVALREICSELGRAGVLNLRTLCIVSSVEPNGCAQKSISELSRRLPRLETVHAHYWDEDDHEHRVTWIRCWRLSCPGERLHIEEGAFHTNAPCSPDCSMTTFIGLKKPRH